MKNVYQCEKCGKLFLDYDECYKHESMHWNVCGWCKEYERASAELTQYSEKYDAPSVLGIELTRWDSETGEEQHSVGVYHLKEFFMADRLISDKEREQND